MSIAPRALLPFACALVVLFIGGACAAPAPAAVALRLQVSLTADELNTFEPALEALDAAHPEFTVSLEQVPQANEAERINTQLAGDDMPDVLRVQGLNVQQWIRRDAFLAIDERISTTGLDLADFYDGPLAQFQWQDQLYGVPDTASPEVVFFDREAFGTAGLETPDESWTYDDMRDAAIALTADGAGRSPTDAGFDPDDIQRWGWHGGLTYFWQNVAVRARGGNWCANDDCTLMDFTSPANVAAAEWWVSLVRDDHAALYDPYGGSQTGVPGDPFLNGKTAMIMNGTFAIGQLNALGTIDYDIAPPLLGVDGQRHTAVSTNGYVISAGTQHPEQAWALVRALTSGEFLADTWGRPGHAVPARRSVAASAIDPARDPANQQAILDAIEVGEVFRPSTANGFAAYGATIDLFTRINKREIALEQGLAEIEAAANDALEPDRSP
jgi:multiple sugar transport system substrate-binding protein